MPAPTLTPELKKDLKLLKVTYSFPSAYCYLLLKERYNYNNNTLKSFCSCEM